MSCRCNAVDLPVILRAPPPIVLSLLRNGPIRAAGSARSPGYCTAPLPSHQRRHRAAILSRRPVKQSYYCCWRTRRAPPVRPWPGSVESFARCLADSGFQILTEGRKPLALGLLRSGEWTHSLTASCHWMTSVTTATPTACWLGVRFAHPHRQFVIRLFHRTRASYFISKNVGI